MKSAAVIQSIIGAALGLAACGTALALAQGSPFSVPRVRDLYQERVHQIEAGVVRENFSGSASVVQRDFQDYMASIGLSGVPERRGHFCGGVIVAPRWILTAAHCVTSATRADGASRVTPIRPGKIQVLIGSNVLYRGTPKPIARIVVHPAYRVSSRGVPENDLALLQSANALNGVPIKIANVAQFQDLVHPGHRVLILGWGTARFRQGTPISPTLLFAYVSVVEHAKCALSYGGSVTATMFCAGAGEADSCRGDSGGPAIVHDKGMQFLVGITSWGAACAHKARPGVYVDVTKFRGWIDGTIGKATQ